MRHVRFLRRNPLLVLAALAVAFAGWVCWDALGPPAGDPVPASEALRPSRALPAFTAAAMVDGEPVPPKEPRESAAQAIPKLKPGMSRAEVEGLVGAPVPGNISPATAADGRIVYHTQYQADLSPPATVRPIGRARALPPPAPPALVTLEFDATKPGHPLVGVYYPDPLF